VSAQHWTPEALDRLWADVQGEPDVPSNPDSGAGAEHGLPSAAGVAVDAPGPTLAELVDALREELGRPQPIFGGRSVQEMLSTQEEVLRRRAEERAKVHPACAKCTHQKEAHLRGMGDALHCTKFLAGGAADGSLDERCTCDGYEEMLSHEQD